MQTKPIFICSQQKDKKLEYLSKQYKHHWSANETGIACVNLRTIEYDKFEGIR